MQTCYTVSDITCTITNYSRLSACAVMAIAVHAAINSAVAMAIVKEALRVGPL